MRNTANKVDHSNLKLWFGKRATHMSMSVFGLLNEIHRPFKCVII